MFLQSSTAVNDKPLSEEKFKDSFFTLKTNKSPCYDNLDVIVIWRMYHDLKTTLINIFSQSLSTGMFPDKMKILNVSPAFKNCEKSIASNYKQISVLPFFSKILERISL